MADLAGQVADVPRAAEVVAAVERVGDALGDVDLLVGNAGARERTAAAVGG